MINSAEIRNFRCFEQVSLRDCRTLNIAVGTNASGKTALLEAIFLALASSPEVVLRMRAWHGYEQSYQGPPLTVDEAIWGDLFYRYETERTISISLIGSDRYTRALKIEFRPEQALAPTPLGLPSAAIFSWTRHGETPFLVRPLFGGPGGYQFPGAEVNPIRASFFAASAPFHNAENVMRFSDLSRHRAEKRIISSIHEQFGFIDDIDIAAIAGQTLVHGDLPALPQKIPLNSVSSGVNKFVTLVVAVAAQKGGVLFVDEIENGFHYARFVTLWKTLYSLCKANHVQLFASTHSRECLDALAIACEEHTNDVSFIHSELQNGIAVARQFHGDTGFSALRLGEIR